MLLLANTTDSIQVITGAAADIDVHVSFVDLAGSTVTPGRQNTYTGVAATITAANSPTAGTIRNIKLMTVRSRDTSAGSLDVTILFNDNGTTYTLFKATLAPGDTLQFIEGAGFFVVQRVSPIDTTPSTADQTANAVDTYLAGGTLVVPSNRPIKVGTRFRWTICVSKTAAGTAGPIFNVRFGTTASTTDTARLAFAGPAGTAAIDTGVINIDVIVRGPIGAACVVHGRIDLHHNLATTGLISANHYVAQTLSAAFDITTPGMTVGVSINPGVSGVWTIQQVMAEFAGI